MALDTLETIQLTFGVSCSRWRTALAPSAGKPIGGRSFGCWGCWLDAFGGAVVRSACVGEGKAHALANAVRPIRPPSVLRQ